MFPIEFPESVLQAALDYPHLHIGRVVSQSQNLYLVVTRNQTLFAEISGKLRHTLTEQSHYPTVGDYVLLDRENAVQGHAMIQGILPRRSVFLRRAAGTAQKVQAIAANIDIVFLCMALDHDFNLRRLERYLAIAWDSGAKPVVVLTKADRCQDLVEKRIQVAQVALGTEVIVTSSVLQKGHEAVLPYVQSGYTVAFLGSSGVGKSSLINRLLGEDTLKTNPTGKDDKGRHTTTRRELIQLPGRGAVIDTPGMRELGLDSTNLARSFSEIHELAQYCKFKDCQHDNEPGCAVKQALEDGRIRAERLLSYQKLKKEAQYEGLDEKQIEKQKRKRMFHEFQGQKNARKFLKTKENKD